MRDANSLENVYLGDLSFRQLQVIGLLAQGQDREEISETLDISVSTVDHHIGQALLKSGAKDAFRLTLAALFQKKVSFPESEETTDLMSVQLI